MSSLYLSRVFIPFHFVQWHLQTNAIEGIPVFRVSEYYFCVFHREPWVGDRLSARPRIYAEQQDVTDARKHQCFE